MILCEEIIGGSMLGVHEYPRQLLYIHMFVSLQTMETQDINRMN